MTEQGAEDVIAMDGWTPDILYNVETTNEINGWIYIARVHAASMKAEAQFVCIMVVLLMTATFSLPREYIISWWERWGWGRQRRKNEKRKREKIL